MIKEQFHYNTLLENTLLVKIRKYNYNSSRIKKSREKALENRQVAWKQALVYMQYRTYKYTITYKYTVRSYHSRVLLFHTILLLEYIIGLYPKFMRSI